MAAIILHQWEMSPFCNKVRRCLKHKGLDFEVRNYNGLKARKAATLSEVGTLPVLDHDETRTADSKRIAEFLDQQYPEAPLLYPADAVARAQAHVWEDWAGQSLYFFEVRFRMLDMKARAKALDLICAGRPKFERVLLARHFRSHYPKKLRAQGVGRLSQAEAEAQFFGHLDALEAVLSQQDFLVGSAASIADISVVAQIDEVCRTSELVGRVREYKAIAAWMGRLD